MNIFVILLVTLMSKGTLSITSPAFNHNENIPSRYTCEGEDINPAITIRNIPKNTVSLVLIMDDPDATNGTFDHWIVWNITPQEIIAENTSPGVQGKNGTGSIGYKGPCPPTGTHRYFFKLYALDTMLDLPEGSDKKAVEKAMNGRIIANKELIGKYKKTK